uniref:Mediator of RNA polymerase II transcription subunit 1 n=1 Tax=Otus sunia TaxID=257818 RepID=A0A8C8ATS2_9STRI
MSTLLERLHAKYNQNRPWTETMKLVRQVMEKRVVMNSGGHQHLVSCLETLQKALKVSSLPAMTDRLESIARQNGLGSHLSANGTECYITSDMFYVEVQLDPTGLLCDVKVAHHGENPVSCPELVQHLREKNFDEFSKHLRGLVNLYKLPGDNKLKTKMYLALQSLELDLSKMAGMYWQATNANPLDKILHGSVGYLTPRSGGLLMNLKYYVSPYDLFEDGTGAAVILHENNVPRSLGMNVSVTVEGTMAMYKLPIAPLIMGSHPVDSKGTPSFSSITSANSVDLPACFFLKFPRPIPVSRAFIQKLQGCTGGLQIGIPLFDTPPTFVPLYELITQFELSKEADPLPLNHNMRFYAALPGQQHCYFLNKDAPLPDGRSLQGTLISKIAFQHPGRVPLILSLIRHQVAYNTLIGSCVKRTVLKEDSPGILQFEVCPLSDSCFSVSFQHPVNDSLVCVVMDVQDSTHVNCKLYKGLSDALICTDDFIAKVVNSVSISYLSRWFWGRSVCGSVLAVVIWKKGKFGAPLEIPFQTFNHSHFFLSACPRCHPGPAFSCYKSHHSHSSSSSSSSSSSTSGKIKSSKSEGSSGSKMSSSLYSSQGGSSSGQSKSSAQSVGKPGSSPITKHGLSSGSGSTKMKPQGKPSSLMNPSMSKPNISPSHSRPSGGSDKLASPMKPVPGTPPSSKAKSPISSGSGGSHMSGTGSSSSMKSSSGMGSSGSMSQKPPPSSNSSTASSSSFSSSGSSMSSSQNQHGSSKGKSPSRNKKPSLTAVIDKLKHGVVTSGPGGDDPMDGQMGPSSNSSSHTMSSKHNMSGGEFQGKREKSDKEKSKVSVSGGSVDSSKKTSDSKNVGSTGVAKIIISKHDGGSPSIKAKVTLQKPGEGGGDSLRPQMASSKSYGSPLISGSTPKHERCSPSHSKSPAYTPQNIDSESESGSSIAEKSYQNSPSSDDGIRPLPEYSSEKHKKHKKEKKKVKDKDRDRDRDRDKDRDKKKSHSMKPESWSKSPISAEQSLSMAGSAILSAERPSRASPEFLIGEEDDDLMDVALIGN